MFYIRLVTISIILIIILIIVFNNKKFVDENLINYQITIQDHQFSPNELTIPKNTTVRLIITNNDNTAEEFESLDLKKEKIIPGHGKISIILEPLESGLYKFFGEFHPQSANGTIKVN